MTPDPTPFFDFEDMPDFSRLRPQTVQEMNVWGHYNCRCALPPEGPRFDYGAQVTLEDRPGMSLAGDIARLAVIRADVMQARMTFTREQLSDGWGIFYGRRVTYLPKVRYN